MAKQTPPVKIRTGTLTGTYDKQGEIAIFKGIPYAATARWPVALEAAATGPALERHPQG